MFAVTDGSILLAGVFALACSDEPPTGVRAERFGVSVSDGAGATTSTACSVVPLLLGARTHHTMDVAGQFSLTVLTSNQFVEVLAERASFDDGTSYAAPVDELRAVRDVRLVSDAGEEFTLHLGGGCGG